jgi:outer membrane protein assembly factor BamE (lipoprotein component of BamABCDE complex)
MNRLSVGMTKKEVVSTMGEPSSTAAPGHGEEFLRYELSPTVIAAQHHITQEYYIRLIDGKVESYGRMGDFDSAKDPTVNYNIKNR